MPPRAEAPVVPDRRVRLTYFERIVFGLLTEQPGVPIHAQDLLAATHPGYNLEVNETEMNVIRPTVCRLRDKIAGENLTIYGLNYYHSFFLGPVKPEGAEIILEKLPNFQPKVTLPTGPESLLRPFYRVRLNREPTVRFLARPVEFKLLLALIDNGIGQPISHRDLFEHLYPDRNQEDLLPIYLAETLRAPFSHLRTVLPKEWQIVVPPGKPGFYQLVSGFQQA